jgi:hypothetical protein
MRGEWRRVKGTATVDDPITERPGTVIGPYKLLEAIGEGGMVKAHETTLSSGQEFVAGSTASLRCTVEGVKSISESIPLGGSDVTIRLREKGKVHELYTGKTVLEEPEVNFNEPALPIDQGGEGANFNERVASFRKQNAAWNQSPPGESPS